MPAESPAPARVVVRRALLLMFLVAGMGVVIAWRLIHRPQDEDPPETTADAPVVLREYGPPSDEGFVGSTKCAECHAEIAEAYATHPMARSVTPIDPSAGEALLPPEETRVDGTQLVHHVEMDEGVMVHHEQMYDAAGELIYDYAVPMEYVVGSGRRGKAYLHQRGGLLFMSPLNWYPESGVWDVAPGYTSDDPRRFDRRVKDECLSCHMGRAAPTGRSTNVYETPPFHEMSIGCERCHGPGAEHVALWERGGDVETDPIVNPARLEPACRESVCNQCHLIGAARVLRHGRSHLDFRPGQNLDEIWSVLVAGRATDSDDPMIAVSQAEQMHQSRCYAQSDGRFGCISCHDPHEVPAESERVAFYRDRCLACHQEHPCSLLPSEREPLDDSCIACHMPPVNSSNITHVSQTDHRVLKRPSLSERDTSEPHSLVFFDDADERLNSWERDRALGVGTWLYFRKMGYPRPPQISSLLTEVLNTGPEDSAALTVLATMAMDNNNLEQAREYYERARLLPDAEETAIQGLLKIAYLSGEWEQVVELADEAIAIDPGYAGAHAMKADALVSLGEVDAGIEAGRTALRWNPTLLPVHEWLARTLGEQGRGEEQRAEEELIRRMRTATPPR